MNENNEKKAHLIHKQEIQNEKNKPPMNENKKKYKKTDQPQSKTIKK